MVISVKDASNLRFDKMCQNLFRAKSV